MIVFVLIVTLLQSTGDAVADNLNPGVFGINESPYDKTYEVWTTEWWKWIVSIPNDINPALDRTGEYCNEGQSGNVHFLAGTGGGSKDVECQIPAGVSLLFPVIAVECSYAESPALKTEADLHACAKSDQDTVKSLSASIDGVEIKSLENYRIHSGLFNLSFPENNLFGIPEGQSEAVSDGYWVFLKPLENGPHLVEFSATLGGCTVTDPVCLSESSIYRLEVG